MLCPVTYIIWVVVNEFFVFCLMQAETGMKSDELVSLHTSVCARAPPAPPPLQHPLLFLSCIRGNSVNTDICGLVNAVVDRIMNDPHCRITQSNGPLFLKKGVF
jgi:hypothetical protein